MAFVDKGDLGRVPSAEFRKHIWFKNFERKRGKVWKERKEKEKEKQGGKETSLCLVPFLMEYEDSENFQDHLSQWFSGLAW